MKGEKGSQSGGEPGFRQRNLCTLCAHHGKDELAYVV